MSMHTMIPESNQQTWLLKTESRAWLDASIRASLWRRGWLAALALAGLSLGPIACAQEWIAPEFIGGLTVEMTITEARGPFATSGVFRFLPSAVNNSYFTVRVSGDITASTGSYSYYRSGPSGGVVTLHDAALGTQLNVIATFTTADTGVAVITIPTTAGAYQNAYFRVYSGPAPASAGGLALDVTITGGSDPLATSGAMRIAFDSTGAAYMITGVQGVNNSTGTCTYSRGSSGTAALVLNDSVLGQNVSVLLWFKSATEGTYVLTTSTPVAYQTGLFQFAEAVAPAITRQPRDQTVAPGADATFTVEATGSPPLAYQWWGNGQPIPGATGPTLTIRRVEAQHAGAYAVVISNAAGFVTSDVVILTVQEPVRILTQPQSQSVVQGGTATFAVVAIGTPPLTYQWWFNGAMLEGATASTLRITGVGPEHAGAYVVVVSGPSGFVTSEVVSLTLVPPLLEPPRIENLSRAAGVFSVEVLTVPNRNYLLEYKTSLADAAWTALRAVAGDGTRKVLSDLDATTPQKFYRLKVE